MKSKKSLVIILAYIAAALFVFNGVCKIFNYFEMVDFLAKMNFSRTASIVIGILEIAGAVGLLIPSSRATVSFLLILLVVGAIGSEIGAGFDLLKLMPPAVVFVLLAAIAYYDNMIAAEEEEEEIEHRFDNVK
ncbi:MAG: DoxX-like family [Bacteroidota bacterium]|jgi:uncharacterized membrane protein